MIKSHFTCSLPILCHVSVTNKTFDCDIKLHKSKSLIEVATPMKVRGVRDLVFSNSVSNTLQMGNSESYMKENYKKPNSSKHIVTMDCSNCSNLEASELPPSVSAGLTGSQVHLQNSVIDSPIDNCSTVRKQTVNSKLDGISTLKVDCSPQSKNTESIGDNSSNKSVNSTEKHLTHPSIEAVAVNKKAGVDSMAEMSSVINANVIPYLKKSRTNPVEVSTLVFFDLETTGLPQEIGKHNVQITELTMIAISRAEYQHSSSHELEEIRVIQKLCLCVKPRAMVSSSATKITGLDNINLSEQNLFDENAAMSITSFLSHLPQPVCLIAHNGATFDFPLLKAEISRISVDMPSGIFVVDTLKAFRQLGVPDNPPEKINKSVKYTTKGKLSYTLENLHLYFFNKKPKGSHSSEGDCITLAKVCHQMKDIVLPWIDDNCILFDSIKPMW